MKLDRIFYIVFFLLFITSCAPSYKLRHSQQQRIEQRLGLRADKHDDLKLLLVASNWVGVPYCNGGTTMHCCDCSGAVGGIFYETYRKRLSRSSSEMWKQDIRKKTKSQLRPGDLIFFTTSPSRNRVNHVGIYLKDGYFIHASSTKGVVLNNLGEPYYKKHYKGCGRVK